MAQVVYFFCHSFYSCECVAGYGTVTTIRNTLKTSLLNLIRSETVV